MDHNRMIEDYLEGPQTLREAVQGMTEEQMNATPIPGEWSVRQIICYLSDLETISAIQMKRIIVQDDSTLFDADPVQFSGMLGYDRRDLAGELQLIDLIRKQMAGILQTLTSDAFEKWGNHSKAGSLSLADLLARVIQQIPEHVASIQEKQAALSG